MSPTSRKKPKHVSSSDEVEKQLERYRSMRNFDITQEPAGEAVGRNNGKSASKKPKAQPEKSLARESSQNTGLPFVVQKHAATRLHYDFRLGWRGVLKSWAVTKGPSYFPGDKRLAVQVEDHPIEYGGFEGIIPKGQYGGGTVMVWDQGTWAPHGNADEGFAKGHLKFTLNGTKLKGDWALIRMGGKAADEKKPNWLLIKEHDGNERTADDPCVTDAEPDSVVTGRSLEQIASHADHVWGSQGSRQQDIQPSPEGNSDRKGSASGKPKGNKYVSHSIPKPMKLDSELKNLPEQSIPDFIPPQLALQVAEAPEGPDWLHELKLDGYRIQGRIDHADKKNPVKLLTRSGLDWTHRMPRVAQAAALLPVESAVLDGEVVVLDESGSTSFAKLQAAFQGENQPLNYFVFDLLYANGRDLRGEPLERRKEILARVLNAADSAIQDSGILRLSEHLEEKGQQIFQKACELGAEGIVSKKRLAPYVSGRSASWLKIKCVKEQEFVIGGFTLPEKSNVGIGALLLGYYEDGRLIYAGRTGTGFTQKMRLDMRARLDAIRQPKPAFDTVPADGARHAIWVQPKYVCEVGFATWTADNLVRQASFHGLREDKPAAEVHRELPINLGNGESRPARSAKPKKAVSSSASHQSKTTKAIARRTRTEEPNTPDAPFPIKLSHPDKLVDEESGLTKHELAEYLWAVRDHMLPHIADRPLSVVRCPEGSTKPCFFQKHVTRHLPGGIDGIEIRGRRSGIVEKYITISKPLGLAALAQMGVLEIHPWGSKNEDIEKPDRIVFDLDPDEAISWKTLVASAGEVRERLRQCKLESFVKTTGGKGLHIVAPIQPNYEWPIVKKFAMTLASHIEADNPQLYLIKMTKAARKNKIFIDYLRNDRGATSVAAYSPRARHGAPVALPLRWDELHSAEPPRFQVADYQAWKTRVLDDPWQEMLRVRQSLRTEVLKKLGVDVLDHSQQKQDD